MTRLDALPRVHRTTSPAAAAVVPAFSEPLVSFVSVAYGTGAVIVDSVRTLVAALAATGIAYEYIVVDNAHPDAGGVTKRELALWTSGVTYVESGDNLGFGGGCELGVLEASGPLLAFVNPDVEFVPGFLEPLIAALDDPAVAIAAPVLLEPDGRVQEAGQRLRSDASTDPVVERPEPGSITRHDFASAACWLMRRTEHERLGGFDAAFHPAYLEDVDLALRAARLGAACVVVGDSVVVHHRGASTFGWVLPDLRPNQQRLLDRHPDVSWRMPGSERR